MSDSSSSDGLYTMDDVKKHKSKKSCWIAIRGNVYDVTKFLDEHPGGDQMILDYCQEDATEAFEDASHSPSANDMLETYKIGQIRDYKPPGGGCVIC